MLHSFAGGTQTKEQKLYEAAKANGGVKRGLQRSQAADWPRLAEAPGSLRHAPPLKEASGEPDCFDRAPPPPPPPVPPRCTLGHASASLVTSRHT